MADTLKKRIARHIRTSGPLPVAEYMHWCMADREDGYYRNQVAIGRRGDFITAPEVSQMFGELISIWCRLVWEKLGKPKSFNLVELGPGRGVLMSDILRASKSSQQFADAISVHLVEIGEPMVEAQKEALSEYPGIQWHRTIKQVPQGPSIIIANEFLDVLPIRQFVKASGKWHERCVTINEEEKLDWCLGSGILDESSLPDGHDTEPDGAVYEISAARESFLLSIAAMLEKNGGAALLIDYGHTVSGFGDTLQAIRAHKYADPLEDPGNCDLTSHVDFAALAAVAEKGSVTPHAILSQGEFLLALGLLQRAGALGQQADENTRKRLVSEAERLALPTQMGSLFKVFAISTLDELPPFEQGT